MPLEQFLIACVLRFTLPSWWEEPQSNVSPLWDTHNSDTTEGILTSERRTGPL